MPSKRIAPPTMRPGGVGTSRMIDSAVTLLPQPDSPTTPSVSPGADREATRRRPSARRRPACRSGCAGRSTSSSGGVRRSIGRIALTAASPGAGRAQSRRPSPSRLMASTVSASRMPGYRMMWKATATKLRPSAIMLPQLGVCGGMPTPRNDSDGLDQHGRGGDEGGLHDQRRHHVRQHVAPQDRRQPRADRVRRLDEELLAQGQRERAHQAHDARDLGNGDGDDHGGRLARVTAISAIASRMPGIAIRPSITRMTPVGARTKPATRPMTTPSTVASTATDGPTTSETRPPQRRG